MDDNMVRPCVEFDAWLFDEKSDERVVDVF